MINRGNGVAVYRQVQRQLEDEIRALHQPCDALPGAVLLDRDGFAILHHIRSTPRLCQLPVIMVTEKISDGYVRKPFKWEALSGWFKKVL